MNTSNQLTAACLAETRHTGALIESISEAILFLCNKRATFEEKIIRQYLHKLIAALSLLVQHLHSLMSSGKHKFAYDLLASWRDVNLEIRHAIDDFLKTAKYDPNFMEQYFEHEFCRNLTQEWHFVDKVEQITSAIAELNKFK